MRRIAIVLVLPTGSSLALEARAVSAQIQRITAAGAKLRPANASGQRRRRHSCPATTRARRCANGYGHLLSGHEKIPVCGQLAPGVRSSKFRCAVVRSPGVRRCPDASDPSGMGGFEVTDSRPSSRRDRDQVCREIMEILEAFDLTGCAHSELATVDVDRSRPLLTGPLTTARAAITSAAMRSSQALLQLADHRGGSGPWTWNLLVPGRRRVPTRYCCRR